MYFFLLVLGVPLNLCPNVGHKCDEFSETLLEKNLKFNPSKRGGSVVLNLGLMLLPAEVDPVLKERGRKKNMLGPCGTGYVEMVLTLST